MRKPSKRPKAIAPGFVILARAGAESMIQTIESVRTDVPQFVPKKRDERRRPLHRSSRFDFARDDFADTVRRLEGYPIALPERAIFCSMREIGVVEPGGHTVIFAARS